MRSVTVESAQAAWNRLIDPDRLSILVVGDAATIRTGLETLGLPIVVLDADGRIVSVRTGFRPGEAERLKEELLDLFEGAPGGAQKPKQEGPVF